MKKLQVFAVLAVALIATVADPASADVAADRCGGSKMKATSKYAKAHFGCYASALRRNEAVDPECTAKAAGKLATAFGKAETVGGCVTADDEASAQAVVDAARTSVDALLTPEDTDEARTCASAKLKSSG